MPASPRGEALFRCARPSGVPRASCSGGLRPLVELCVEPAGLCGRCTGVRQPTRLPRPWDSPGKNTEVGGHFLPQGIFLTHGYPKDTDFHLLGWQMSLTHPFILPTNVHILYNTPRTILGSGNAELMITAKPLWGLKALAYLSSSRLTHWKRP